MFEEKVTTEDGRTKRVVASSKEELKEAVNAVKNEKVSTPVDINVPLQKGHDLLAVDAALVSHPVDGTGAHNSPLSAINEDTGEVRGSDPMYVVTNESPVQDQLYEVTGSGETKEVDRDVLEQPDTAQREAEKLSDQPETATASPNTEGRNDQSGEANTDAKSNSNRRAVNK